MRIWGFQNASYDWHQFDLDRDMPIINSKVGFVDAVDRTEQVQGARRQAAIIYGMG